MEASAASTISARIGEPRWLPNRADIWHVLSALITHGLSTSMAEYLLRPRRINSPVWTSRPRSEEHTSELQSLMRISYAVFCLKKKNKLMKKDAILTFRS